MNTSIPRDKMSVQYSTVRDAIRHIKEVGLNSYLAKTDIKLAFRIVPIHPDDHHLLGMKWKGMFAHRLLDVMCHLRGFSTGVQWIAINKLDIPRRVYVYDDFLITAPLAHEVQSQLQRFLEYCEECGIPITSEKTEGPEQTLAFFGITVDVSRSLSMFPKDKLQRCRSLLQDALAHKTMTLRELQSLLGHLKFACRLVVPGRAFL